MTNHENNRQGRDHASQTANAKAFAEIAPGHQIFLKKILGGKACGRYQHQPLRISDAVSAVNQRTWNKKSVLILTPWPYHAMLTGTMKMYTLSTYNLRARRCARLTGH